MVTAAVFKEQAPWWFRTAFTGLIRTSNWCDGADSSSFSPSAARTFVALSMRDGAREQRFTYPEPRDKLPLPSTEQKWSDDTQITIEPALPLVPRED